MVSGFLWVGASGAGAAGLGGAFCSGTVGCSPDFLETEAGRADTGVCGVVAGEGCTSFFLMAVMRSRLKYKNKLFEVLKISELREEEEARTAWGLRQNPFVEAWDGCRLRHHEASFASPGWRHRHDVGLW